MQAWEPQLHSTRCQNGSKRKRVSSFLSFFYFLRLLLLFSLLCQRLLNFANHHLKALDRRAECYWAAANAYIHNNMYFRPLLYNMNLPASLPFESLVPCWNSSCFYWVKWSLVSSTLLAFSFIHPWSLHWWNEGQTLWEVRFAQKSCEAFTSVGRNAKDSMRPGPIVVVKRRYM